MSGMYFNRDVRLSERGLLGDNGIFGGNDGAQSSDNNPFGIGGLTSFLPSISVPGFGPSPSSSSSTITLTKASTTSTTSSSPSATSSSQSVSSTSSTSVSSASTTALSSTTSTSASSTDSATSALPTSPLSSTSIDSSTNSASHSSSIVSSSSTSASAAALPASSPKGFLQNKALSVGVITACSLVGLVLFIALTTWAVRRRRRNKLHDEAVDWSPYPSSDGLLDGGHDAEKGKGIDSGSGIPGDGRRASGGSGSGENFQSGPSTESLSNGGHFNSGPGPSREMYERTGYPALPVFVSSSAPLPAPPRPQIAYPNQTYQAQSQGYNDPGPYPTYNRNAYQPNAPLARPAPTVDTSYPRGLAPRPTQRKQAPVLPSLNISAARADVSPPAYPGGAPAPSPISAISLTASPIQPASTMNPANPRTSPVEQTPVRPKRSSLLNSPVHLAYASGEGSPSVARSHSQRLDPSITPPPVLGPLPEEFGRVVPVSGDEKAALRQQLTVRNE